MPGAKTGGEVASCRPAQGWEGLTPRSACPDQTSHRNIQEEAPIGGACSAPVLQSFFANSQICFFWQSHVNIQGVDHAEERGGGVSLAGF